MVYNFNFTIKPFFSAKFGGCAKFMSDDMVSVLHKFKMIFI